MTKHLVSFALPLTIVSKCERILVPRRRGTCIAASYWAMREEDGNQAVRCWWTSAGAKGLRGGDAFILHRGQWLVASRPGVGGAYARRDKRIILVHTPIHASWLNQVEIYFSIIQRKGADAERFRETASGPRAAGVVRGVEQPHAAAVCMEVHSTGSDGMAKTCVAAFFSSFCCLGGRNRETTTLFVKRTT